MKVHLSTLGCRLNEAELETWSRQFRQRGHQLDRDPAQADLLVVNTCAVTDEAVRKSRKLLRRVQRDNPQARLVVSGCYASLNPQAAAQLPGVDLLIDNRDKSRLVALVSEQLDLPIMPVSASEYEGNSLFRQGRQRAFIKVQDGCRYRCSYCIVTQARGEERSRDTGEIIEEINQLHRQGVQEVVLAGVHLGGYGSDSGTTLSQLIASLLQHTAVPRIRLGSLEPWDIPVDFWHLFASDRLMPHLHLPLQSGADSVLRRMSRRCRQAEYRQLIARARSAIKDLNVTTDIIVGFPGETRDEWRQTMDFVDEMGFGHIHIFAFSARQGTRAATLPEQVPTEIKRQRSQQLLAISQRQTWLRMQQSLGRTLPVLIEGDTTDSEGYWQGYTPNYLRVSVSAPDDSHLGNRIVMANLNSLTDRRRLCARLLPDHQVASNPVAQR
jgi:threonylcarbamoyladenosine tRNA methylthiotransferase MtaB